jgi:hypothetical protein
MNSYLAHSVSSIPQKNPAIIKDNYLLKKVFSLYDRIKFNKLKDLF